MTSKFKGVKVGQVSRAGQSVLTLRQERFENVDFSRRTLDAFRPIGCAFTRCDFRFWNVKDMCFASGPTETIYRQCQFDGGRFSITVVGPARFEQCSFEDVDVRGLMCAAAEFVDCTFSGVIRTGTFRARVAEMYRPELARELNEFRGNDFMRASLRDVSFGGGIDLDQQRFPEGKEYAVVRNALPKLIRATDHMRDWPATERSAASSVLKVLTLQAEDGQRDLFITKGSFRHLDSRVLENLLKLLAPVSDR